MPPLLLLEPERTSALVLQVPVGVMVTESVLDTGVIFTSDCEELQLSVMAVRVPAEASVLNFFLSVEIMSMLEPGARVTVKLLESTVMDASVAADAPIVIELPPTEMIALESKLASL